MKYKYIIILFSIALVGLSCTGKKSRKQVLIENIDNFKKEVSVELKVFEPENYVENQIDTTLNNGIRVKIKTYTDMERSVLFTKIKDTVNYQTHYRNFKFDILVEKKGQVIYHKRFDKQKMNKLLGYQLKTSKDNSYHKFNEMAVLQTIQLNDESYFKDKVIIDLMYGIPNSERYAYHKLVIDKNGNDIFIQDL